MFPTSTKFSLHPLLATCSTTCNKIKAFILIFNQHKLKLNSIIILILIILLRITGKILDGHTYISYAVSIVGILVTWMHIFVGKRVCVCVWGSGGWAGFHLEIFLWEGS